MKHGYDTYLFSKMMIFRVALITGMWLIQKGALFLEQRFDNYHRMFVKQTFSLYFSDQGEGDLTGGGTV